ncbi:hypothetical protein TNCT_43641 [Trichonephila clavata]|uniref:Uncharacterized protein n=1 Tax=Trichonephila clavata TaxID=2740835 RepID=A0A8X6L252_TRICU|nr:hypothetical protein TNCT_43641 [Trichonephila clavata]
MYTGIHVTAYRDCKNVFSAYRVLLERRKLLQQMIEVYLFYTLYPTLQATTRFFCNEYFLVSSVSGSPRSSLQEKEKKSHLTFRCPNAFEHRPILSSMAYNSKPSRSPFD